MAYRSNTDRSPVQDLQRRLHRVINNDALAGLADNGTALREQSDPENRPPANSTSTGDN
jgi:hypothetical protein